MSYQNKVAIIIGNGVSRTEINLKDLTGQAPIYGCNALYRDFDDWDYLVCFDQDMVQEVRNCQFPFKGTVIVPPIDRHYEDEDYSPQRRRNNAGMLAMREAIERKSQILYCLGFDFLLEGEVSVDNVYRNTVNYGPETHANMGDNYHRIKYLQWFAEKNSDCKFIFVFPDGTQKKAVDAENVYYMDSSVFLNKLTH